MLALIVLNLSSTLIVLIFSTIVFRVCTQDVYWGRDKIVALQNSKFASNDVHYSSYNTLNTHNYH